MNCCSSSKSALVRARDQAWVPGNMRTPRQVIGYRFGRRITARRERRPVVEIDQGQLAVRRDDDVAAVDFESGRLRRTRREANERGAIEGVVARVPRIEPVKEAVRGDAVELDLVACAMLLHGRGGDAARVEVGAAALEGGGRIDPLH